MPWAAAGSIIGGVAGAAGSIIGGNDISNASKSAENFQKQVYSTEGSSLAPYQQTGQGALYSLASLLGVGGATPPSNSAAGSTSSAISGAGASTPQSAFQSFTQTPYYQFPLQQAMLQIQRSNSARGLTNSGATAKDLLSQATGYASSGLGSYLSQLSGLASGGQNATTSLANTGLGTGTNVANSALTGAGAQASALGGAIQNVAGQNGSNIGSLLQSLSGSSYSGTPTTSYNSAAGQQLVGEYNLSNGGSP
jgi:hypothetical protein